MADKDKATPNHWDAIGGITAAVLEIARLREQRDDMLTALRDAVKHCRRCDGSGKAPNEDGRMFSDDPAFIDCPDCATQRAAIAKAAP